MEKKFHYIQRTYIDKFSVDGNAYVYDKKTNKIWKSKTSDVFEVNDFFRIPLKEPYEMMTDEQKIDFDNYLKNTFNKTFKELDIKQQNYLEESYERYLANTYETKFPILVQEIKHNIGKVLSGEKGIAILKTIKQQIFAGLTKKNK